MNNDAFLVLANGQVFEGKSFGAAGSVTGETVFTTGMAGYLETLTDPSYYGQIVVQTFPLIGNYGVIPADFESSSCHLEAYLVRSKCDVPSNFRSEGTLDSFLNWIVFFVTAVCTIAQYCVYLKMSRTPDPVSFGDFFAGFTHWLRAIGAALWRRLWTYLWMLLFVIPGIVKAIAYSQTFFIVAEFPHVPVVQALDISKKITRGHKADLFVLYLSFLGWYLLCVLTLGIASLWVVPYQTMTCVNAYHALMKQALESGVVTIEDIGDVNGEHYGKK